MDSNFNNENEPWEFSLDIDDFDLHLTPVVRSSSSTHVEPYPYTPNPVRIIPGSTGIVQQAKMLKEKVFILDSDGALLSTQEYTQKVIEDVGEDDDFKSGAWVSATNYVLATGRTITWCLGDIDNNLKKRKLDRVIAIVKSRSPNALGDLTVTMKDLSVFTPKPSKHYLNITKRNVINVFRKDTVPGSGSGFIKGTVVRSATDANLAELWDTCNNMEIWQQLEKMFSFSDGSRKYKLNKDTYEITQSGCSIGEYYTKMKCVWEELVNINVLPVISVINPKVSVFLAALNKQKEDQRLFQFLNGLEEHFSHQRSQILMIYPLPSDEVACSLLQQEESQRLLFKSSVGIESTALLSKKVVKDKCSICRFKWHPPEKCWEKVGYPPWHAKFKGSQQARQSRQVQTNGRNQFASRTTAHVKSGNISFTPQQFEQLMKTMHQMSPFSKSEEEIDHQFMAGTTCLSSQIDKLDVLDNWIYDTGASDHMTPVHESIFDPYQLTIKQQIRLPNGDTSIISHVGKVKLHNGILLKDVLVIPSFKFSLLFVSKLTEDSQNIWGPYKVPTNGKFRYFLATVDDCSRVTWVYLPEQKSDAFDALKSFLKFMATQFEKQVKIMRFDNALEFVKELIALDDNGTWERNTLPAGKKAIGSHWLFKTKLKDDGTEERNKARLVIQENRQRHGVDYQETFAPVAKLVTIKSLLAVTTLKGCDTCQMDVSNAFLHGDLLEEVYMRPPFGYSGTGKIVTASNTLDSNLVCKLKKSIYGLKQAPRQWFFKLLSVLVEFGYTQYKTDYSLFVKKEGSSFIVVLVYVDDLLITGNDQTQISKLKAQLSSIFHMKDLGEINYFLGLEVCRSSQGIFISQHKYTRELLKESGVLNNKPYKLPIDHNLKLQADVGTSLPDPEVYRRVIGQGILLANDSAVQLKAYYDSDRASCPMTRRSTTGYYILLGDSPISWKSKKQAAPDPLCVVVSVDQHTKLLSKLRVSEAINSQLEGECTKEKG
ncbi:cysteine-rich receptor-like protein kinase 8 [Tanacetum coccineum]